MFTLIYTPPPAALECSETVYRRSAFSNFFLAPNEERKRTSFEVYQGLNAANMSAVRKHLKASEKDAKNHYKHRQQATI